eukprot:358859-Chlamydomonas_euryale.AAC.3
MCHTLSSKTQEPQFNAAVMNALTGLNKIMDQIAGAAFAASNAADLAVAAQHQHQHQQKQQQKQQMQQQQQQVQRMRMLWQGHQQGLWQIFQNFCRTHPGTIYLGIIGTSICLLRAIKSPWR